MADVVYADSWTTVCNRALSRLGDESISALSEGSDSANLCIQHLGEAVGTILEGYDWNCLKKRVELAPLAESPVYGFDYAYQLPSDFARLIEVDCDEEEYSVEGNTILTDATEVYITYIHHPTDAPAALPESFLNAITMELCATLALPLTSNVSLHERLLERAATARMNAIKQDARGNREEEKAYTEDSR